MIASDPVSPAVEGDTLQSNSSEEAQDLAAPEMNAASAPHSEFVTPAASPVIAVAHLPVVPDPGDARADGAQGEDAKVSSPPSDPLPPTSTPSTTVPTSIESPLQTTASQIYARMLDSQIDADAHPPLPSDNLLLPIDRLHCRSCLTEAVKPVATPCGHIFCYR